MGIPTPNPTPRPTFDPEEEEGEGVGVGVTTGVVELREVAGTVAVGPEENVVVVVAGLLVILK